MRADQRTAARTLTAAVAAGGGLAVGTLSGSAVLAGELVAGLLGLTLGVAGSAVPMWLSARGEGQVVRALSLDGSRLRVAFVAWAATTAALYVVVRWAGLPAPVGAAAVAATAALATSGMVTGFATGPRGDARPG